MVGSINKKIDKLTEKSRCLFLLLLKVIKSFAKLKVLQWNLKSKQILKLSSHEVHHLYIILTRSCKTGQKTHLILRHLVTKSDT